MALQEAKDIIARIVKQRGFKLIGVRLLPTDNKALGASALATEPHVLQMFVENTKSFSDKDFDRCVNFPFFLNSFLFSIPTRNGSVGSG